MRCLVTAGPTSEPLDAVRRLTNLSTGELGGRLANALVAQGHEVILLRGAHATWSGRCVASRVEPFVTTLDLEGLLCRWSERGADAVFHAAAVSDFRFGTVWREMPDGRWVETVSGKHRTDQGRLRVELVPTPNLIERLRGWFPRAFLAGWKYEVDGGRSEALDRARAQIAVCRTNCCVANGPAYGAGFGLVSGAGDPIHCETRQALLAVLTALVTSGR